MRRVNCRPKVPGITDQYRKFQGWILMEMERGKDLETDTYIKPILWNLRRGHLSRAILAVLQTRVEVREALHRHRQVRSDFVQT